MSGHRRVGALLALMLGACASGPRATLHTAADAMPSTWTRIRISDTAAALHREGGGAIIANIACDAVDEDAPLDVLINHVLLQLEAPVERGRRSIVLDGRAARRARLGVKLDGVAVELDLVVFKKDGCVIDAQLAAAPDVLASCSADFERFVSGLTVERKRR